MRSDKYKIKKENKIKDEEIEEETEESEEEKPKSHKILNFFLFLFVLFTAIFFYAKYIGTKGLIVKEYRVKSNILTSNFSGLKIIHFSDLLYKSTIDKDDVKQMAERINILKPDIVVFTGNLVTNNIIINDNDTEFLKTELSKINASIGKFAINGELDYSYKEYEDVMNSSGFKILNNSYEEIYYKTNQSMFIVGLPSSLKENIDLTNAFKFYNDLDRKYTIVLTSEGKTIKYLDDSTYEVDLILGGYSLNGNIVIPFYNKGLFNDKNTYKYSEPYYQKGITNIYISSGLGTKKYGYRLFNKPSFNLYRLKAQS